MLLGLQNSKVQMVCSHNYQIAPAEFSEKECIQCGFVALRNELYVLRSYHRSAVEADEANFAKKGHSASLDEILAGTR